jgi:hypothetical protein
MSALRKEIGEWRQLVRLYALRLRRVQRRHAEALGKLRLTQDAHENVLLNLKSHEAAIVKAHAGFITVSLQRPLDAAAHLSHIVGLGRARDSLRRHEITAHAAFKVASRQAVEILREVNAAQTRCDTAGRELRQLVARAVEKAEEAQE